MKKIILFILYFLLIFSTEDLKASNFKKTFSEDQKGINGTFRKCTVLTSKNTKYLSCKGIINNFDKIYLSNVEGAQFGEYLRYQIGAETSWFSHSGFYYTKDNIEIVRQLIKKLEIKKLFKDGGKDLKALISDIIR